MGQNGAEGKPLYSNVTDEERCERARMPQDKAKENHTNKFSEKCGCSE